MITNTSCTVYRYNSDTQGYDRLYIPCVMWQDSKAANVIKSGLTTVDSTSVYIPMQYADSAPKTAAKDMLVKGDCSFEWDNSTFQTISQSRKQFDKACSHVTVSSIDVKDYSLSNLNHIKISAK